MHKLEHEIDRVRTAPQRLAAARWLADHPLVYLACPYSDPDPAVQVERFEAANRAAAMLLKEGYNVFSPISMCHPIAVQAGLPGNFEFWERFDRAYLAVSNKLFVLRVPGWEISTGVNAEIQIAREKGITILYIDPQ